MSFKRESMPSINESDNEEEESFSVSEISTSDYSSLNRQKNSTLTKAVNELINLKGEALDKGSTLKQIDMSAYAINNKLIIEDNQSNNSNISHSLESDNIETVNHCQDITDHHELNEMDKTIFENKTSATKTNDKTNETEIDRFGFLKGYQYTDPNSDLHIEISVLRTRERKWLEMLNKWDDYKNKKRKKMVSRCRKGIPQSMRCKAWQFLCNSRCLENTIQERAYYKEQSKNPKRKDILRNSFRNSTQAVNHSDNDSVSVMSFYSTASPSMKSDYYNPSIKNDNHDMYENYKKITPNSDIIDQIRKDIHRQFPNHENFMMKGGLGQESLSTILTVYSVRHPETGYCQGMAPVAAALLMVMPEEEAFWTFDKLLDSYIPGYYDEGLKQIQNDAKALNALLKKESSSVYNYMSQNNIDPICYMIDWFMCIYIRTLPWPSVLQVMDMFMCEGKTILFKVALVLVIGAVSLHKQGVKDYHEMELLSVLRNLPDEVTSPKYITTHIAKLSVTKTDIRRECQNQEKIMMAQAKLNYGTRR